MAQQRTSGHKQIRSSHNKERKKYAIQKLRTNMNKFRRIVRDALRAKDPQDVLKQGLEKWRGEITLEAVRYASSKGLAARAR